MIQDFGKRAAAWQETKKLPPEGLAPTGVRSGQVAVHVRQNGERDSQNGERKVRKGMLSKQGWVGNLQNVDRRNVDQQNVGQRSVSVDQQAVDQ